MSASEEITLASHCRAIGKMKTPKKKAASLANLAKANAMLTPEVLARRAKAGAATRAANKQANKQAV